MAIPRDLPSKMRGILLEENGGIEKLLYRTNLPVPTPKKGQVLVKNAFIGINYIDTYFRTGLYPTEKPLVIGQEAEGVIVAVGELWERDGGLRVGQRVWFHGTAAYAEYTVASVINCVVLPGGLEAGVATSSLFQALTARTMITEAYAVQPGDWVLVHAAAGGVGLWFCQLLRNVGAKVIGTASTDAKCQLAEENGAEWTINYSQEKDLVARVMDITCGTGVHVVYDGVGKDMMDSDLDVVARKGTVVSYGNSSGAVPPFNIARLKPKNLKLLRPTVTSYIVTKEELDSHAQPLLESLQKHEIEMHVHKTYALQDVGQAHAELESRATTGKLLLEV